MRSGTCAGCMSRRGCHWLCWPLLKTGTGRVYNQFGFEWGVPEMNRVIDFDQIKDVFEIVETVEGLARIMFEGIEQIRVGIDEIEDALVVQSLRDVQMKTHFLKGTAESIGFSGIRHVLQMMHDTSQDSEDTGTTCLELLTSLGVLRELYGKTRDLLFDDDQLLPDVVKIVAVRTDIMYN